MAQKQTTGWVGWIYFASMMMLILGGLQTIAGFVALFKDNYYVVTQNQLVVFNYAAWGWINIIMGIFIIFAGVAVMKGRMWGRIVASLLVVLNAISNLTFLSAYPVWSIIALIIDGLVLYALTVHGGEAEA